MKCVQDGGHRLSKDRHKHAWELTKERGEASVQNTGMVRETEIADKIGCTLLVCEVLSYSDCPLLSPVFDTVDAQYLNK